MRQAYEKPMIEFEEYLVYANDYSENVGEGDDNPDKNSDTGGTICYDSTGSYSD